MNRKTILLVEDEHDIKNSSSSISNARTSFSTVDTGEEAL